MTAAPPAMPDLYEEWAAETLSYAKGAPTSEWANAYGEMAAEMLSLANLARRGGIPEE